MKIKKIMSPVIWVLLSLIIIFPIYILFMSSFKGENEIFATTLIPKNFTLENFILVFESGFLNSIKNSFIVATSVTVIALILHAMAGYALARMNFPGRQLIFRTMMGTLMIPFTVIMVPLFMITKSFHMTNSYLGLIIPSLFNAYGIFMYCQFYRDFPAELEEAAYMEGCSRASVFFRIVLPLSKPVMIPLTIAFFLGNWNNYLWPLIVNKKKEFEVVQVALANLSGSGYATPWNVLIASAAVAALPTFILFLILQKYLVEGIKMSGIK